MAMDEASDARRRLIAAALRAELDRQAGAGITSCDVDALARAADMALEPQGAPDEGKRPEDLNATNDD